MVETPTVLILGAGASMSYGFPSGFTLLRWIEEHCAGRRGAEGNSNGGPWGVEQRHLIELGEELRRASVTSIDAFLEKRREYLRAGKFSIACQLIPCEAQEGLFDISRRQQSWYQRLFEAIEAPSFEELKKNRLSVLTYNYDRSLEHFLHVSVQTMYNEPSSAVAAMLSHIPIVHLHGQLGKYSHNGLDGRQYTPATTGEGITRAIDGIRIICEPEVDSDDCFREAHNLLDVAERVVFIGFGYHPTNLARLRLRPRKGRQIFGTCYGMGNVAKIRAKRQLPELQLNGSCLSNPLDILGFLDWEDVLS